MLESDGFELEFSEGCLVCAKFDINGCSGVNVGDYRLTRATKPLDAQVWFGDPASTRQAAATCADRLERDGATLALEFDANGPSCAQLYAEGYLRSTRRVCHARAEAPEIERIDVGREERIPAANGRSGGVEMHDGVERDMAPCADERSALRRRPQAIASVEASHSRCDCLSSAFHHRTIRAQSGRQRMSTANAIAVAPRYVCVHP